MPCGLPIIGVVILGKMKGGEPEELRICLAIGFSAYLGIYFWMLSDMPVMNIDR
jgi:hypothetical protein